MEDLNVQSVVSLVKTYTSDWKSKKSTEKKKGITRIAGLSKQKHERNQIAPIGLTNQNFNNSNYKQPSQRKQKIVFHQQVEKGQRLREQAQKGIKLKEPTALVQSHYINCQQDVQQWIKVKQKLQERINNLQVQNNFLKINLGIQQQYIIKIQTEVDSLRLKCQSSVAQAQTKTQQQAYQKVTHPIQHYQVQCELQEKGFQQFQKFSKQVEEQTTEFFNLIKKLEDEKQMLIVENNTLLQKFQRMESRVEEQNSSRDAIKNNLSRQISSLVQTEYNLKMRLQSFEQSKSKMLNQINEQNKLYQREKQLRIQLEKQKQAALKIQMQKIVILQAKCRQYKQVLDNLLSFLQQKNEELIKTSHKISNNQLPQHRQRKEIIIEYQDRVDNIKKTILYHFDQLIQYRIQNESYSKLPRTISQQAIEKEHNSNWQQKQKQIGQDIGYLLNKVATLQELVDHYKKNQADRRVQMQGNQNLLQVQFHKINHLQQQNEALSMQLQESTKQVRYIQHLITSLQEQNTTLKNIQCCLNEQNRGLKTELTIIDQQLQMIKQQCNEDRMSAYELREEKQKQKEQIEQLTKLLQNTSDRLKKQLILADQQKNRYYFQRQEISRQLDSFKVQSVKLSNTIQSLRKQMLDMSHKYEQMAKAHATAKRDNVRLVQQSIQLKQKNEVIQHQIQLIVKSHRQSLKQMQEHMFKLQTTIKLQKQQAVADKEEWERQKQLVKKDYDILYNKYLKYKNIALQAQPHQH